MARWRMSFSLDGARWRRYAIGLPLHCHFAAQARAVALLVEWIRLSVPSSPSVSG